jgi:hypothetical protein
MSQSHPTAAPQVQANPNLQPVTEVAALLSLSAAGSVPPSLPSSTRSRLREAAICSTRHLLPAAPDPTSPDESERRQLRFLTVAAESLAVGPEQAAALFGVSGATWDCWDAAGLLGPIGVRMAGLRLWPLMELREWAAAGMPRRREWLALKESSETPSSPNRQRVDLSGGEEPPIEFSRDFRSCRWGTKQFTFTAQQAACVRVLWESRQRGTFDVSQITVLGEAESAMADSPKPRLRDLFRSHPAWGTMIVKGSTRGTYRLAEPGT